MCILRVYISIYTWVYIAFFLSTGCAKRKRIFQSSNTGIKAGELQTGTASNCTVTEVGGGSLHRLHGKPGVVLPIETQGHLWGWVALSQLFWVLYIYSCFLVSYGFAALCPFLCLLCSPKGWVQLSGVAAVPGEPGRSCLCCCSVPILTHLWSLCRHLWLSKARSCCKCEYCQELDALENWFSSLHCSGNLEINAKCAISEYVKWPVKIKKKKLLSNKSWAWEILLTLLILRCNLLQTDSAGNMLCPP